MPQYEVTYFDGRGYAEPIRQILAYIGADWKDNRLPFPGPGRAVVPDEVKHHEYYTVCNPCDHNVSKLCRLPIRSTTEFEGKRLVQSVTIARFLARKHGIGGKDDLESAHADEIVDAGKDMLLSFMPAFQEQDETKKAKLVKTLSESAKNKFLSVFNTLAEKNGGYLAGNSLTWADIVIANYIYNLEPAFDIQLLDDLPALKKLSDTVFNAKGIKEYIAKRPVTKF